MPKPSEQRLRCFYCHGRGKVCAYCGKGVDREGKGHDECRRMHPDGYPPAICPVCYEAPKLRPTTDGGSDG